MVCNKSALLCREVSLCVSRTDARRSCTFLRIDCHLLSFLSALFVCQPRFLQLLSRLTKPTMADSRMLISTQSVIKMNVSNDAFAICNLYGQDEVNRLLNNVSVVLYNFVVSTKISNRNLSQSNPHHHLIMFFFSFLGLISFL